MIIEKKFKKYIIVATILVSLLISTPSVGAAENNRNLNLDFKIVQEGLDTTISKINDGIDINFYSNIYSENSYAYIYQDNSENWENYEYIVLQVKNKNNSPMRINLETKSKFQGEFLLKDNGTILLENWETNTYSHGKMVYSNIEIPAEFEGNVYIGFDNFINKENNNMITSNELENVISWGITFIPSNEGENSITLNKVELLKQENSNQLEQIKNIHIIGNNQVQIPGIGEGIEFYSVTGGENIKFSLLKDYKGVSISEDGKLLVTSDAESTDIIIEVSINNEVKYEKVVELKHSWAFNQVDQDGVPYGLLSPENSPTSNELDKFMAIDGSIKFMRILLVAICLVCLIIYVYWKNKRIKRG